MLKEMLALLAGSIPVFAYLSPTAFRICCIGGVLLAAILWWLCTLVVHLWNISFRFAPAYHLLCGLAALWTIFFVVAFASAHEVGQTVDEEIASWTTRMHELLALTQSSSADAPATTRPATSDDLLVNFSAGHPFLGKVLRSTSSPLAPNEGVTSANVIDRVAKAIADTLRDHLDSVEIRLEGALLLSLLLAQAIPFGLTGYLAHRDIRPSF